MKQNLNKFKYELVNISDKLSYVAKVDNKKKELGSLIDGEKTAITQGTGRCLPIDSKEIVKWIITEECSVFKSAKCPVKYTFKVTPQTQKNNVQKDKKHFKLIFEYYDDLRQDQLILQLYGFIIKKSLFRL